MITRCTTCSTGVISLGCAGNYAVVPGRCLVPVTHRAQVAGALQAYTQAREHSIAKIQIGSRGSQLDEDPGQRRLRVWKRCLAATDRRNVVFSVCDVADIPNATRPCRDHAHMDPGLRRDNNLRRDGERA